MRPEQYCEGNVLVPGTAHYYALRRVSRDKRGAACVLSALSALPPAQYKAQRPTLVLAAIWRATLAEISRSKVQLLRETIRLTPLRMRWIALHTPYSTRPKKTRGDH